MLDPGVSAGQSYTYDELFEPILEESLRLDSSAMPSPGSTSSTTSISRVIDTSKQIQTSSDINDASSDLVDAYYQYFHPAHPFLVPWRLVQQRPSLLPDALKAVIRFVGSHYIPHTNKDALKKATAVIFADDVPDDGFKVQALMLYCIICFARYEQMEGAVAMENAIQTALRIGMNRHNFATTQSPSDPTLQETWRRTWWALFSIDGLVTAIAGGQGRSFRLHEVFCDVPLPGDCTAYANLNSSPNPPSLATFRNRTFSEDTTSYSSLAYGIEAMYIMGAILSLGADTFVITDPQVEAIDTSIANFFLALPPSKREVVEADGHVDEPLLMAHMIINWSAILLHRPRSTLTFIRNHYATVCTKKEAASMPALAYTSHTSKTLRAANALIQLASIQRPLSYCTPCLMCGITTAATVHLPAYAIAEDHAQAVAIKERLQLAISALGRFAEIWTRAEIAKSQVAAFAREVLTQPNVSVDSSGFGLPVARSIIQPEVLDLPGGQAQLEYTMSMSVEDQWLQSIMQQDVEESAAAINVNRSSGDNMAGFKISA